MYLSVSGIDFATVSMIIRMDFGIVATVNFFFSLQKLTSMKLEFNKLSDWLIPN
jgi:hypothetical protein